MSHHHDKSLKTCHLSVAKRGLSWRMPSRNGFSKVKNSQFVKNLAICVKFPNLWKILQFEKNCAVCEKFLNLWKISQFIKSPLVPLLQNCAICDKFSNLWQILQFVKNLAICDKFSNLWKILQFVENFAIFEKFLASKSEARGAEVDGLVLPCPSKSIYKS